MPSTKTTVCKFGADIEARRYANSKGHIRTVTGAITIKGHAKPQDMIHGLCVILTEQCKDLHSIGRIDITLHNES